MSGSHSECTSECRKSAIAFKKFNLNLISNGSNKVQAVVRIAAVAPNTNSNAGHENGLIEVRLAQKTQTKVIGQQWMLFLGKVRATTGTPTRRQPQ